jgi:hypothetical protein
MSEHAQTPTQDLSLMTDSNPGIDRAESAPPIHCIDSPTGRFRQATIPLTVANDPDMTMSILTKLWLDVHGLEDMPDPDEPWKHYEFDTRAAATEAFVATRRVSGKSSWHRCPYSVAGRLVLTLSWRRIRLYRSFW